MTTQTKAPERTDEQKKAALKKANGVRGKRARFKAQMKRSGRGESAHAQALDLLTTVPSWAETMKVPDLLMAIPGVGRVRVNKMLNATRTSPSKTLGGLSERQRKELKGEIGKL